MDTVYLTARVESGKVVIYDGDGRLLGGVINASVNSEVDSVTTITATFYDGVDLGKIDRPKSHMITVEGIAGSDLISPDTIRAMVDHIEGR